MSVMAETSHSAIGPYSAMAAVGLALYAWTAVCREALVVKVATCGGDGDGGGGLGVGGEGDGDGGGGDGGGGLGEGGDGAGGEGGGGEGDNGMHTPQVTAQACWIWLHGRKFLKTSQLAVEAAS